MMKKKVRKIAVRVLVLLLLFIFLTGVLTFRSSLFQTYVTQQVGDQLSKQTNAQISIGNVEFRWLKRLLIRDLLILDHQRLEYLGERKFIIVVLSLINTSELFHR